MTTETKPDLCHGYHEIGSHLGLTKRQAKHLAASGLIPTFKLGRTVCALRSKLDEQMARQATAGKEPTNED